MKCQLRSGGIFRKSKKAVEKAHGVCGLEGKKVETNKEQNHSICAQFFRFRGLFSYLVITFLFSNVTNKLAKIMRAMP